MRKRSVKQYNLQGGSQDICMDAYILYKRLTEVIGARFRSASTVGVIAIYKYNSKNHLQRYDFVYLELLTEARTS